jgi:hypothetical protein
VKKIIGLNRYARYLVYLTIRYIHQINNLVWKNTLLSGRKSNHQIESAINILPSQKKKKFLSKT